MSGSDAWRRRRQCGLRPAPPRVAATAARSWSCDRPHRNVRARELSLELANRRQAVVQDTGDEYRVGAPLENRVTHVVGTTRATRRDHRNAHRLGHRTRERQIEARPRAIAIDAREEYFARPTSDTFARPRDRVDPRGRRAPMRPHLPAIVLPLGIDARHDALRTEALGALGQQLRPRDGRGVDAHLVRPGAQHAPDVVGRTHAAANSERHEDLHGRAPNGVEQCRARFPARGDVEENDLVGALELIARRELHRIADVPQPGEADPLHDAAIANVEADDEAGEHQRSALGTGSSQRTAPLVLITAPLVSSASRTAMPSALNAASTT